MKKKDIPPAPAFDPGALPPDPTERLSDEERKLGQEEAVEVTGGGQPSTVVPPPDSAPPPTDRASAAAPAAKPAEDQPVATDLHPKPLVIPDDERLTVVHLIKTIGEPIDNSGTPESIAQCAKKVQDTKEALVAIKTKYPHDVPTHRDLDSLFKDIEDKLNERIERLTSIPEESGKPPAAAKADTDTSPKVGTGKTDTAPKGAPSALTPIRNLFSKHGWMLYHLVIVAIAVFALFKWGLPYINKVTGHSVVDSSEPLPPSKKDEVKGGTTAPKPAERQEAKVVIPPGNTNAGEYTASQPVGGGVNQNVVGNGWVWQNFYPPAPQKPEKEYVTNTIIERVIKEVKETQPSAQSIQRGQFPNGWVPDGTGNLTPDRHCPSEVVVPPGMFYEYIITVPDWGFETHGNKPFETYEVSMDGKRMLPGRGTSPLTPKTIGWYNPHPTALHITVTWTHKYSEREKRKLGIK